jgi:hypothetical protein
MEVMNALCTNYGGRKFAKCRFIIAGPAGVIADFEGLDQARVQMNCCRDPQGHSHLGEWSSAAVEPGTPSLGSGIGSNRDVEAYRQNHKENRATVRKTPPYTIHFELFKDSR